MKRVVSGCSGNSLSCLSFSSAPHPLPTQILQWLQSEVDRLASQHTDIGEISEDAVEAKTAFEEIMQKRAVSGNGVCACVLRAYA